VDKVAEKLDIINKTLEKQTEAIKTLRPQENPFVKGLTVAGVAVGALGILQVIDIVIGWFGG